MISGQSIKAALDEVSKVRLEQTVYAEYADLRLRIEQTLESLAALWRVSSDEATEMAQRLVEIGFFESRLSGDARTFWVPLLYRGPLHLTQGRARSPGVQFAGGD